MLHLLNPPDRQCEDDLFALVEWQRKTLLYARDHDRFRSNTFRSSLGDDFADWFEDSRRNGHGNQRKAFNNFQQNLNALAKCDLSDKQMVLDDFEHDQNFYFHLDDPDFIFAFSPSLSVAHDKAKVCLNAFYEFLTWEYPAALVASQRDFHRQDIVESYLERNPTLLSVCPCCDNSWPEPSRANRTPYTLEHFFHKDEHASICLHPYNLIPMCGVCNGRRGNKDVLSPTEEEDLSIDQIFHPIERPVRKYAHLQFRSRHLKPEIMNFVNLPTRIDDWQTAIDAYEAVYEIPKRWETNWNEIQRTAFSAIQYALQALQHDGAAIDQALFGQQIERIIETFMQDYGRYQYPAGRWLVWAKQHKLEHLYEILVEER